MDNFEEALQNIGFCKVIVKKMPKNSARLENKIILEPIENSLPEKSMADEPLIDVFEEEDYFRILIQCRCREQQVTFYVHADGIKICREECHVDAGGTVVCADNCQKINLRTDHLQLENRLFVVAQCNNNAVLEAMIPKKKLP